MSIWFDSSINKDIGKLLDANPPTDVIRISDDDLKKIYTVYAKYFDSLNVRQQDIIKARLLQTLPFYSFQIEIEDKEQRNVLLVNQPKSLDSHIIKINFIFFSDKIDSAFENGIDDSLCIGVMEYTIYHILEDGTTEPFIDSAFTTLFFDPIDDNDRHTFSLSWNGLIGARVGIFMNESAKKTIDEDHEKFEREMSHFQISINHLFAVLFAYKNPPEVHAVFVPDPAKSEGVVKAKGSRKKRPVEYVRHIIDYKGFRNFVNTEAREFIRYTNVWGVMGHIRHYKNGKEVYIHPYEKGKDRNKGLLKEPKDRILRRVKTK